MTREAPALRKAARSRAETTREPARPRGREQRGLDSELSAVVDRFKGDSRLLGAALEGLLDAQGVSERDRAAVYEQLQHDLGPATARQAFFHSRAAKTPGATAAQRGVLDHDAERAATTAGLVERLASGMKLDKRAVTVDVTDRASAEVGARGARGVAVGNTIYPTRAATTRPRRTARRSSPTK